MSENTKREFIPFGLSPEYYKQRTVEKRIEVLEKKIRELEMELREREVLSAEG